MVPYIHIFFFAVKMLQDIHIFVGFWSKCYHIYTHFGVFLGSKCCNIHTFVSFFWGQNDTIYTHFGFFLSKCCYIYTFCFFLSKCCNIYIFVSVLGIKMLPYIHILGFFWGQNAAIYTHFLEFNFFPKKRKKKTTIIELSDTP